MAYTEKYKPFHIGGTIMKKRDTLATHFKKRLLERCGIDIRKDELERLLSEVKKSRSQYVASQSNNKTLHKLTLRGIDFYAIYSKRHSMFVTVITEDMLREDDFYIKS